MDFSWIFLALFLAAAIMGIAGALARSMLKNLLRLASALVAFLIVLLMQVIGVLQGIVNKIMDSLDIISMLPPEVAVASDLISALISTLASMLVVVILFVTILLVLRVVIFFVMKKIEPAEQPAEASNASKSDASEENAEKEKQKAKEKKPLFSEAPWKVAISALTGLVGGILILSVVLTPIFYIGSIGSTVAHSVDGSDAKDSKVYKSVEVVDKHFVTPYEDSFVIKFYDALGLSDLMNYTVARGGKIVLSDGTVVFADDVMKNTVSHALNAASELTSIESECSNVKGDVEAIVNNPLVFDMLTNVTMSLISEIYVKETEEDNLLTELVTDVVNHYKEADRATIESDLRALGSVAGVVAEEKVLVKLMSGEAELIDILKEYDTLDHVIEAISVLSSFPPIIEDAFSIGVNMTAETFSTPHDDREVYDAFIEDLLNSMVKTTDVKFDENTIKYYVYTVANQGKKVSASNGVKGHSMFIAYTKHWARVQSAFAHASEDKSYGYFTMEINGQFYIYDPIKSSIIIYSEENEEIYANYKNKISPAAGLINALSLRSRTTKITPENLNTILTAYAGSAKDNVSVEIANRMLLGRDGFTTSAVTIEKMLAACDFSAWNDPEIRKADSHLYVGIIIDLLDVMETVEEMGDTTDVQDALVLVDDFAVIGEAMDFMHETSCTTNLPELVVEAIIKSDLISNYISPDIAFKNIEIVQNHENQTYVNCMRTVAANLKFAISFAGGVAK